MKVRSDVLASTLDRNLTKSAAVEEEEDDEENVWLELLEKMLDGLEDESRPSVELADRISSELMFRTMSAVTAVIGVLIAYLVSALMYLVVVKNADLVASAPATIDVFNEDCKFSPKERLQYAAIGLALLLVFDLMLAFQLRASLLTTPFYIVKAILAGLMLIHTHKLSSKLESATSNAALFMA